MLVESVNSAMTLLITPIFPFKAPLRLRLTTRPQKVREKPKQYMESETPKRPTRITGLRPMRSDARLQLRTVHAWVAKKMDCWRGW